MSLLTNKIRALKESLFSSPKQEEPLPFPDTLSIESSYACNLKCVMCPRHFEGVPQGMFSLEMFEKYVEPYVGKFKYLHLTGWGEPLMNRDLPEIIKRARAQKVHTCFTSNGLLLKNPLDRKILEANPESMNISCDADNAVTYEQVRGKGTFDLLIERMKSFNKLRVEMGAQTRMMWVFVMMRSNFEQLPNAIRLAAECGFHTFGAKHMETAVSREDLREAMWNTGFVEDVPADIVARHDAVIAEAIRVADEVGIDLFVHTRRMDDTKGMCLVRPVNNLFIDYMGRVSACCYLNPNDVRPYNLPHEKPKDTGVVGDLRLGDLMEILESPLYRDFQRTWRDGKVAEACKNCLQVQRIHTTSDDGTHSGPDRAGTEIKSRS
jgi:MoaA/NifB/PqqE/SkfB family radical SAM enzyme